MKAENNLDEIILFKNRFNKAIDASGLTSEQIARRTGRRRRTIDKHRDYSFMNYPNGLTLKKFAQCLNVTMDYLAGND